METRTVYLDNAATTQISPKALEAMMPYFSPCFANPSSLHTPGQQAREALEEARRRIAGRLGCKGEEIIFTSGGSEAEAQAILSAAKLGAREGKMHIVSSTIEHHAVLSALKALAQEGFEVTLLEVSENGVLLPRQVAEAIRGDTCLVTVMYANNEIGTIQPIAEIGRICREKGVLFHTDAVQAAGQLPINVEEACIDLLSLSAHKFHGPKGVGALYAKKGIRLAKLIPGGGQERGNRGGTENVPAAVGMAAALEEACDAMEESAARLTTLRDELIRELSQIPHAVLNGDGNRRLPGNVNFCFEGVEGEALLLLLDDLGVFVSSGSACTSGSLDPSHVLLAIGRPHDIAHGSLRLTLSRETTREEILYAANAVRETVAYLRGMSPVWQDLVSGKKEFKIK